MFVYEITHSADVDRILHPYATLNAAKSRYYILLMVKELGRTLNQQYHEEHFLKCPCRIDQQFIFFFSFSALLPGAGA